MTIDRRQETKILRFLEGPQSPFTKASVATGIVSKLLHRAVCASPFQVPSGVGRTMSGLCCHKLRAEYIRDKDNMALILKLTTLVQQTNRVRTYIYRASVASCPESRVAVHLRRLEAEGDATLQSHVLFKTSTYDIQFPTSFSCEKFC